MIKYEICLGIGYNVSALIREVEIEKETDKCVWIQGNRRAKQTTYTCYFDTRKEAWQALYNKQSHMVKIGKERYNKAKSIMEKVNNLRKE